VADEVAARVEKQHGLKRPQFLINASHTHTGPGRRAVSPGRISQT
jgi:hypothetical protein